MDNMKLTKARVQIICKHPFFASLMLKKPFIIDNRIPTACTDGKCIRFNESFLSKLTGEEIVGLICHEILHISLFHHTRMGNRDSKLWNIACDYVINLILKIAGIFIPKGALIDERFDGMTAEVVYATLQKEQQEQGGQQEQGEGQEQGGGGWGQIEAPNGGQEAIDKAEQEAIIDTASAVQMAKAMGKLPDCIARVIDNLLSCGKKDWKQELMQFMTEICKDDYNFSQPNRRYIQQGIILPSLHSEKMGEIVLVVDTSGSIYYYKELLNKMAAEVQEIAAISGREIRVIYCDDKCRGEQVIEPDEVINLNPSGGGGTDFRPPFELIEQEGSSPVALIYFTDLECYYFPNEPEYPVLWAAYGNQTRQSKPKFGTVIQVDDNQ